MDIQGQPAEVRMTIEVKRAETGQVETFELVGTVQGEDDGDDTLNSST